MPLIGRHRRPRRRGRPADHPRHRHGRHPRCSTSELPSSAEDQSSPVHPDLTLDAIDQRVDAGVMVPNSWTLSWSRGPHPLDEDPGGVRPIVEPTHEVLASLGDGVHVLPVFRQFHEHVAESDRVSLADRNGA